MATAANASFATHHTLAAQAAVRRAAWLELAPAAPVAHGSTRRRTAKLAAD